jgi:alcohol dehydrogenase (cytochrome c)
VSVRPSSPLLCAFGATAVAIALTLAPLRIVAADTWPTSASMETAAADADNWILPARTLDFNRFTPLTDINRQNVGALKPLWTFKIADNGEQEAAPIVWHGTMYISTPHDHIIALDAATGAKKWELEHHVTHSVGVVTNRGVALVDGKLIMGTMEGHMMAVDATNGKVLWDVPGVDDPSNTSISMAPFIYRGLAIIGTAGGDFGNIGQVTAFRIADGSKAWVWHSIPAPGETGHETWPGDSWLHGGADVWGGLSIDPVTQTLYVGTGNPGPDLIDTYRKGKNLYSDSIVALNIAGPKPVLKWYVQLVADDTHDEDIAMPPQMFTGTIGGRRRPLIMATDKGGDYAIIDRANGQVISHGMLVQNQGMDSPPTADGQVGCPNHGGGVEWNGGAYDAASNLFIIPATDECGIWTALPSVEYSAGHPFSGGILPARGGGAGVISAIDVSSGKVVWTKDVPMAAEGGALITATGMTFTSALDGHFYALDTTSGRELWSVVTGSSIVSPPVAYRAGGKEIIAVISGEAGNQATRETPRTNSGSFISAFAVPDR